MARLGDMEFTTDDLTSLAAKLDALELTDGERAALTGIVAVMSGPSADGDGDVEGFIYDASSPYLQATGSFLLQRIEAHPGIDALRPHGLIGAGQIGGTLAP